MPRGGRTIRDAGLIYAAKAASDDNISVAQNIHVSVLVLLRRRLDFLPFRRW